MAHSELEALVGHLFIVGGRSISAVSPGAVAMPPPRRAARGRDGDTFFGVLSLTQDQHQPAAFYEGLTGHLSSTYFATSGSVTSALRQAVAAANTRVLEVNRLRSDPLVVGLVCAVLRDRDIYIAVVGEARCFLVQAGSAERLPAEEELDFGGQGLGLEDDPYVRFYHREAGADDFVILSDASLGHLRDSALLNAVESGEVNLVLQNLAAVAGQFSTALVIKLVAPLADEEAAGQQPEPSSRLGPIAAPPEGLIPDRAVMPGYESGSSVDLHEEASAAPVARADRATASPAGATNRLRRLAYGAAQGMANAVGRVRALLEREAQAADETEQRAPLPLAMQLGVVLAVALLVALLTVVVYRFRGQTSQYAQLIREAQGEIEAARAAGSNQAEARPHWETAVFLFDQAAQLRSPNTEIASLRSEALSVLDSYDHVTRVSPALLRAYQAGAYLHGPVVQGLSVYLIDTIQDILYREDLDETGTRLVNREPQIVTRQGELIDNQPVGGLIDLVWMAESGLPQRNVLGVLARNGLLISYSPSTGLAASVLPGFEAWGDPRAVALYERDLYILDAGASEIWRYEARSGGYTGTPQRYFTDVTPDLSDAVDMEIDTNGNLYVLHGDGRISKFLLGRPQTFAFEGLPQPLAHPTAMFLSLSPYDRTLFITDPGGGRLYTLALTGAFLSNYKDADDVIFDALSGVYYQDRPPYVYVTSGSQLYFFSRP